MPQSAASVVYQVDLETIVLAVERRLNERRQAREKAAKDPLKAHVLRREARLQAARDLAELDERIAAEARAAGE